MAEDLYERIVDMLTELHGSQPGYRAAHAKGSYCSGSFTATPQAAELSTAAHLQGEAIAVTVRFSNGSGNPKGSDTYRREGRGIGLKFHLPDGGATDIVALTLPVFFVRNPDDFLEFVGARRPNPDTGEPDMEKIGAFIGDHPETGGALQLILPALVPPVSYATCAFNGLHSFAFTNAAGENRFGRYRLEPAAGVANLSDEEIEAKGEDYLQEEIAERPAREPVVFALKVQLAGDGDAIDDPTLAYPEEREWVELGRLELTAAEPDLEAGGDVIVFDPVNVTAGIETSEDQILHARSKAYSVSVDRRIAARDQLGTA